MNITHQEAQKYDLQNDIQDTKLADVHEQQNSILRAGQEGTGRMSYG